MSVDVGVAAGVSAGFAVGVSVGFAVGVVECGGVRWGRIACHYLIRIEWAPFAFRFQVSCCAALTYPWAVGWRSIFVSGT